MFQVASQGRHRLCLMTVLKSSSLHYAWAKIYGRTRSRSFLIIKIDKEIITPLKFDWFGDLTLDLNRSRYRPRGVDRARRDLDGTSVEPVFFLVFIVVVVVVGAVALGVGTSGGIRVDGQGNP